MSRVGSHQNRGGNFDVINDIYLRRGHEEWSRHWLREARACLVAAQDRLYFYRANNFSRVHVADAERRVLSALNRVWQAQGECNC